MSCNLWAKEQIDVYKLLKANWVILQIQVAHQGATKNAVLSKNQILLEQKDALHLLYF